MQRQVVKDPKKWWDTTRKLWLRNLLYRESLGLARRSLADYAEERARLLHQQLPLDPWGISNRRDMQSAARRSTATSVSTSGAVHRVCQASFQTSSATTTRTEKDKTYKKNKKVSKSSYHTIKPSEKQPPNSSALRGRSRSSDCNGAIVFPCSGSWS